MKNNNSIILVCPGEKADEVKQYINEMFPDIGLTIYTEEEDIKIGSEAIKRAVEKAVEEVLINLGITSSTIPAKNSILTDIWGTHPNNEFGGVMYGCIPANYHTISKADKKFSRKIFGIDFGTTYSCISYVDECGKAVVVPNPESSPVTPSVVAFEEGGNVYVGQAAKETLSVAPADVCSAIKRQMGKRDWGFLAFGQGYSPEAITAMILKKLAKDAEVVLGEEVKDVVIAYPVYWGADEHWALKNAAELAGLNILSAINEPTAIVISYGINMEIPQTILVYDLGGCTFDVTIIWVANGEIRIVATGGDHQLGGKDWDDAIREFVIEKYSEMTGESTNTIYDDWEVMGDLELKAETAKKQLTQKNSAVIRLNGQKIEITREEFEQRTEPLLESSISKMHEVIDNAISKEMKTIDRVLVAGGASYMPQVLTRLRREFSDVSIEFVEPDCVIAKGAAIYGREQLNR